MKIPGAHFVVLAADGETVVEVEDVEPYLALLADNVARTVGKTRAGTGEVSTVFLGGIVFHRDDEDDEIPAVLWETMYFGDSGLSMVIARYRTAAEARAGHADAVARVTRGEFG